MKKHLLLTSLIGISLLTTMPHSPAQAATVTSSSAPAIVPTQLDRQQAPAVNPYVGPSTTNEAIVYTVQTSVTPIEITGRTKVS